MSLKFAMLGYVSWQPFSGYDLKKLIASSPAMYWSGNNNQIYKTLVQLHAEGLVTTEVQQQEHLPARKVYTITEQGRAELKQWALTEPELPELRNAFLVQLAWADQLAAAELGELIERYRHAVDMQLLMLREHQRRRDIIHPARTPREQLLWDMIAENQAMAYANELAWVEKLCTSLGELPQT
jgi:PadR family transcriptional regulator, regulatory protein AphA